jgi:hypothetical protein
MTKSGSGHVIGVPVNSKAYGIEEGCRDPSFRKVDGDHLAVSLTHPSPYASFGYKHSKCDHRTLDLFVRGSDMRFTDSKTHFLHIYSLLLTWCSFLQAVRLR